MTNTPTQDVAATVDQIGRLAVAGYESVRVAVPEVVAASHNASPMDASVC